MGMFSYTERALPVLEVEEVLAFRPTSALGLLDKAAPLSALASGLLAAGAIVSFAFAPALLDGAVLASALGLPSTDAASLASAFLALPLPDEAPVFAAFPSAPPSLGLTVQRFPRFPPRLRG